MIAPIIKSRGSKVLSFHSWMLVQHPGQSNFQVRLRLIMLSMCSSLNDSLPACYQPVNLSEWVRCRVIPGMRGYINMLLEETHTFHLHIICTPYFISCPVLLYSQSEICYALLGTSRRSPWSYADRSCDFIRVTFWHKFQRISTFIWHDIYRIYGKTYIIHLIYLNLLSIRHHLPPDIYILHKV